MPLSIRRGSRNHVLSNYFPCTWISFVNQKNEKNKRLKFVNEYYIYCSYAIIFQNNWSVYSIPILWICRQLKHQLMIRSEIFIFLEIILNAFNVWQYHFRLKSLFWLLRHFLLFHFASSVNLLCCQMCGFYCSSLKRGALFFLKEHMYTSSRTFIKNIKSYESLY